MKAITKVIRRWQEARYAYEDTLIGMARSTLSWDERREKLSALREEQEKEFAEEEIVFLDRLWQAKDVADAFHKKFDVEKFGRECCQRGLDPLALVFSCVIRPGIATKG